MGGGGRAEYVIWVNMPAPEDPVAGWTLEEMQDYRTEIENRLNNIPDLIQYDFRGIVDG